MYSWGRRSLQLTIKNKNTLNREMSVVVEKFIDRQTFYYPLPNKYKQSVDNV